MHIASPTTALWQPHPPSTQAIPSAWRSMLLDTGSLTQRLKERWPDQFHLELLHQRWERPDANECVALKIPARRWALVREVLIHAGNRPRIFARTVIPKSTLQRRCPEVALLNNRSLGEALFRHPDLQRSPFYYGALPGRHFSVFLPELEPTQPVWGRRSTFFLNHHPLLISEFFLP